MNRFNNAINRGPAVVGPLIGCLDVAQTRNVKAGPRVAAHAFMQSWMILTAEALESGLAFCLTTTPVVALACFSAVEDSLASHAAFQDLRRLRRSQTDAAERSPTLYQPGDNDAHKSHSNGRAAVA